MREEAGLAWRQAGNRVRATFSVSVASQVDAVPVRVALCFKNTPKICIFHLSEGADSKERWELRLEFRILQCQQNHDLFMLHIYFIHYVSFTDEGFFFVRETVSINYWQPGFWVFYLHLDWKHRRLAAVWCVVGVFVSRRKKTTCFVESHVTDPLWSPSFVRYGVLFLPAGRRSRRQASLHAKMLHPFQYIQPALK